MGEGLSMKCGFQINLDVQDRICLVIGGEEEAAGRVTRLLEAGGKVTVIHPTLTDELKKLAASAKILHRGRHFRVSDADGDVWLIMNTLRGDQALVRDLFALSKKNKFVVYSSDEPNYSTFTMPAHVGRGPLRNDICTSGGVAGVASRLRQDLGPLVDGRSEVFLEG